MKPRMIRRGHECSGREEDTNVPNEMNNVVVLDNPVTQRFRNVQRELRCDTDARNYRRYGVASFQTLGNCNSELRLAAGSRTCVAKDGYLLDVMETQQLPFARAINEAANSFGRHATWVVDATDTQLVGSLLRRMC